MKIVYWATAAAVLLLSAGCSQSSENSPPPMIVPGNHSDLRRLFADHDYDISSLDRGVPSLILQHLPSDLSRIPQISERKRIFFLSLLPTVLLVNDEIGRQREEVMALLEKHDRGQPLDSEETLLLVRAAGEYGIESDPLERRDARQELLKRLDVVPPSLVLAQAALESGYGTSRFSLQGNNLFGEWTFTPGTGMVPRDRPPGETYELRRFDSLYSSVRSYMRNLNTHRAYQSFRNRRALLRAEGLPLRGSDLARGLQNYSIRGEAYVEDVRKIISRNRLSLLSTATLQPLPSRRMADDGGFGLLSSGAMGRRLMARSTLDPSENNPAWAD